MEGRNPRRKQVLDRGSPPRLPFEGRQVAIGRGKLGHAPPRGREFDGKGGHHRAGLEPHIVEGLVCLGPLIPNPHKRIGREILVGIARRKSSHDELFEAVQRVERIGCDVKGLWLPLGPVYDTPDRGERPVEILQEGRLQ